MRPGRGLLIGAALLFCSPARAGQIVVSGGGAVEVAGQQSLTRLGLDMTVSYGMSAWVARPALGAHLTVLTVGDTPERGLMSLATLGAEWSPTPQVSIWPAVGLAIDHGGYRDPAAVIATNIALTEGLFPPGLRAELGSTMHGRHWVGLALSFRYGPKG